MFVSSFGKSAASPQYTGSDSSDPTTLLFFDAASSSPPSIFLIWSARSSASGDVDDLLRAGEPARPKTWRAVGRGRMGPLVRDELRPCRVERVVECTEDVSVFIVPLGVGSIEELGSGSSAGPRFRFPMGCDYKKKGQAVRTGRDGESGIKAHTSSSSFFTSPNALSNETLSPSRPICG